jgi:hypothetical protein
MSRKPIIPQHAVTSPVNWTAAITAGLALLTSFNIVSMSEDQKVAVLTFLSIVGPMLVIGFRSFMPGKEPTVTQLKTAIAEKKDAQP